MNKTLLSTAIVAAMSVSAAAQAANITSMSIVDTDSDGIAGGFAFASGTSATTKYTHFFDSTTSPVASTYGSFTTDGGGIIPTGEQSSATTPPGDDSFTAGFVFTGYGFLPNSLNAAGSGLTTNPGNGIVSNAVNDLDTTLSFSDFTWSGTFGTAMFPLSPDSGFSTNSLSQGGTCSAAVGSSSACYTLRWEHFIAPQAGFSGDTVWQIEGIATLDAPVNLVPVPAAAWLFGSGLMGLVGVARRRRRNA